MEPQKILFKTKPNIPITAKKIEISPITAKTTTALKLGIIIITLTKLANHRL